MLSVLVIFTASILGFEDEISIIGRRVYGDDTISTVECPANTAISKCQYYGVSDGTYVQGNLCQSRGGSKWTNHKPYVICVPLEKYKTTVITNIFLKEGSVTCPSNTVISDCRLHHYWRPDVKNTKEIKNNTCFVGTKLKKDENIHLNLEVSCIEKIDSYISGFTKLETNGQFGSIGACPPGHIIKSCKCEDMEKCESTEVLNNICRVTYINNSDKVKAKIGCVHNEDLKTVVENPNEESNSGAQITGCTIVPKKCSKTSFKSIHDELDLKCKLSKSSDCHVVMAIGIVNIAKSVTGKMVMCPGDTKLTNCNGYFGTARYINNGCVGSTNKETVVQAICKKFPSSEIIYRKKYNLGMCEEGETLVSCIMEQVKGYSNFAYENNQCHLRLPRTIISVCKKPKSEIPGNDENAVPKSLTHVIALENTFVLANYFIETVEIVGTTGSFSITNCPSNYHLLSCTCLTQNNKMCVGAIPSSSSCMVISDIPDTKASLLCGKPNDDTIISTYEVSTDIDESITHEKEILLDCSLYTFRNDGITNQAIMVNNYCKLSKPSVLPYMMYALYVHR